MKDRFIKEFRKIKKIKLKWPQFIGCYLLCIAIFQAYVSLRLAEGDNLFIYLDPRIGIYAFLESILEKYDLAVVELLTAGWVVILATLFVIGKKPVKTYVISELLLSAPSIFFFLITIVMNVRPSRGFSIVELICPVIVMVIATVIPLVVIFKNAGGGRP
jgi:hypothetical protein